MQLLFSELCRRLGGTPPVALVVSVEWQRIALFRDGAPVAAWPVSTSKFGIGNRRGSYRTPPGLHRIAEKIGQGFPPDTIFMNREPVTSGQTFLGVDVDLIMGRILWLAGCEEGVNRGGDVDSCERYIYIHGTNHENHIGTPASHGCVRMRSRDVVELFDLVEEGTPVLIG